MMHPERLQTTSCIEHCVRFICSESGILVNAKHPGAKTKTRKKKDIAPGEELRVWYAKEYAAIMGTRPLAKPSDVPSLEEESPPSGRQLRPRICPTCRQQRSTCTCSSSLTQRRHTSKSSKSVPASPKQNVGRTKQAARSKSGTPSKIALPTTSGREAAIQSETVTLLTSQSVSGGNASKSTSSEISTSIETVSSQETRSYTESMYSSELMEKIQVLATPPKTTAVKSENISDLGSRSSLSGIGRPARDLNVSSEGVLSSGLRSVASRKQYSIQPSPTMETSTPVVESQRTFTTSKASIVRALSFQRESDVSSEQSSLSISSGIHILKYDSSEDSALESLSNVHFDAKNLEEKNVGISSAGAMESSLQILATEVLTESKSINPIEDLGAPSLTRSSKFMSLRSSLRPSTSNIGLRSKLQTGVTQGKKTSQMVKRSFERSEEEDLKSKKDVKNKGNIQRQKGSSMSESSHEMGTVEISTIHVSSEEVESELVEKRIEGDDFTCKFCFTVFGNVLKLNEHLKSHSGTSESSFARNETSEVLSDAADANGSGKKKITHVCTICSKAFISPGKLSQHLESHSSSGLKLEDSFVSSATFGMRGGGGKRRGGHTCRVCSKVFVSPGRLSSHMYSAHPGLSGSSSSIGEAASTSGTAATSGSGVKKKGNHICPICSKVFGSPGKLSQHMYSHTGERPFACTECNKAFSSKFKLVRHALIHSSDSERRYRCNACERSFHRKDHLQNHAKVHSVVRTRWRCDRCGREYGSPLSHRRHLALHAAQDDGSLDCGVCGRHFSTTPEILHHLKVHAGSRTVKSPADRKFRCDHCERRFFTRKDVRRHLVVHTGKRDFLCQFCPQRFGRKDHLVRHIKKSHHQGSVPSTSRGTRGGRRHKPGVTASGLGKLAVPGSSTTSADTATVEQLQAHPTLFGGGSHGEEVILIPRTPSSFIESKVEESAELPQSSMLEDTSLLSTSQIVTSGSTLKIPGIETMLHSTSSEYAGDAADISGATNIIPKSEEASLIPAVASVSQSTASPLELVYAHPPPPYPSEELQSQSYKVYEEERVGMIKLEPSSSARVGDIAHFLSLIPSTSQTSVLSETLSGVEQESLLMAAQHIRTEEDIQRLLSGGSEQSHLLTSDEQQLLQFVETAASSVVGLELPSGTSSAVHSDSDVMASLLASSSGQRGIVSTTPLPRFTQAFQSQQQQQQQEQPPPPPPPQPPPPPSHQQPPSQQQSKEHR